MIWNRKIGGLKDLVGDFIKKFVTKLDGTPKLADKLPIVVHAG